MVSFYRKFLLLGCLAMFSLTESIRADMDIEIEVEEDEDEDDFNGSGPSQGSEQPSWSSTNGEGGFKARVIWDFDALNEAGIVHMTNELFDNEVYSRNDDDNDWLLVFTKGIYSENPYDTMASINESLTKSLINFSKTSKAKGVRIGYVDIHHEGELLKETFDLESVPSVRLVTSDKVYHLKWSSNGLWTDAEIATFVDTHEESALWDYSRSRVSDGIFLSFEYVLNNLADHQFSYAMENYLYGKKLVFEWTGYKHDLKILNPNMGKKNTFKKSQMRTLLIHVIAPAVLAGTALVVLILMCLCTCIQRCFCSTSSDDNKVKDE